MRIKPFVSQYDKLQHRLRRMERQINALTQRNADLAERLMAAKQEVLDERQKVQEFLIRRLEGQQI